VKTPEDILTYEIEDFTAMVIFAYVKSCQIISCIDTVLRRLQPDVEGYRLSSNVGDCFTVDMTSHP
jgi:hypothetical protein